MILSPTLKQSKVEKRAKLARQELGNHVEKKKSLTEKPLGKGRERERPRLQHPDSE